MNTLHLFAGAGGGIIADMILGHTPVGAVEIDPFCRKVLQMRQDEGWLPKFPIFEDVRSFNGSEIKEKVDCVCGGFPCQDISSAGRGGASRVRGLVYSLNSREYVATYDPATSSLKTALSLFPEDLMPFSARLPKWGTMRNGAVYRRPMLELGTEESDGGASAKTVFLTPKTNGMRGGAHSEMTLLRMVQRGEITEEERIAMGGNPEVNVDALNHNYASEAVKRAYTERERERGM